MHKVEKEIEINAPAAEVFALFSRFDHFSRWMKGIKNVEWVAPKRTRWTAETPDGASLEWEAEVTELEPGRQVAWHSSGGNIEAEGEARFVATAQGTTLMQLMLGYEPPQWQTDEMSVATFIENLEQRLGEDLLWFRLYAEREAQNVESANNNNMEVTPVSPVVALPAPNPTVAEPAVHFDSFSGMLRAGQTIRPARPITTPFDERTEAATVTPPVSRVNTPASAPVRRSLLPYALAGLLLLVAIGLFAATRNRARTAEQPVNEPTAAPSAAPVSGRVSNKPATTADSAPATAPTLVPEALPSPAATLEPNAVLEETAPANGNADSDTRAAINTTINGWLAATNEQDADAQMSFYAPVLQRYYLQRNYSRAAVRAEKARRFAQADSVQMNISAPEINLAPDGRTARVRFRKEYEITDDNGTQSGEVLQELVLINNGGGWRIASERDLRVLR